MVKGVHQLVQVRVSVHHVSCQDVVKAVCGAWETLLHLLTPDQLCDLVTDDWGLFIICFLRHHPYEIQIRKPTSGMYLQRPLVLRKTLYWRFPNTSGRSVEVTLAPGERERDTNLKRVWTWRRSWYLGWFVSVPKRLDTMVTSPVPAPSSITFLSAKLYLSWLVSRKWHNTIACWRTKDYSWLTGLHLSFGHIADAYRFDYRGPQYGSIEVCGLFDADLQIRKHVSLPGFRAGDGGVKTSSHYGLGQLWTHRRETCGFKTNSMTKLQIIKSPLSKLDTSLDCSFWLSWLFLLWQMWDFYIQ